MSSKRFLSKDFLLDGPVASTLYEAFGEPLPILDFHNHLSPADVASNRKFNNLTEAWLEGDHYKWRAMRANGVVENLITGAASPLEKFQAWAATFPYTLRNPLYHWTHLELKNYFGINRLLDSSSAREIYEGASEMLQRDAYTTQGLLKKMNVEVICTTDDPADSLEHHVSLAKASHDLKMYPSFRPDRAYSLEDPATYNEYLDRLGAVSGVSISKLDDLIAALAKRIQYFDSLGCRSADHGLEYIWFDESSLSSASNYFDKIRGGKTLSTDEKLTLRGYILLQLCLKYHTMNWVQQFHLGALRNNNRRMLKTIGPDGGFDSIGDFTQAQHLSAFLSALDDRSQLGKTILYNLNPAYNEVFATMAGNFQDAEHPGKIQFGPAWWFLDQKDGMEKQINTISSIGLLSRFVGMTTDSRSFLSFPRHEYFRRILCNLIGNDVERGELPEDFELLGKMITAICYDNAKSFFRF